MTKLRSGKNEQGVALVVTVIVVAMLAVIGVAFLQSTSADRASSRSVANYMRAQLAAEAGLNTAGALLASQMTNDHFIVVANTNGQLFVGNGSNRPVGTFAYMPLFSTTTSVTGAVTPIVTTGVPSTNVASGTRLVFANLPGGLSVTSPPVSWVYLTQTNAAGVVQTNARFAFWVEDLSGKLDLSVVGTDSAAVARRPTGTNAAEIALWSLFNPAADSSGSSGSAAAQVNQIVSARNDGTLLTPATSRLLPASAVTGDMLSHMAVGLRHDTNEPQIIPFGFGYADQGKEKFNLNRYIANRDREGIAAAISKNLRSPGAGVGFGDRGGAMTPGDYLQNIAANIIDYADTDSSSTAAEGDTPTYRGVESIAWPNEVFTRIELTAVDDLGSDWEVSVAVEHMVEVWNLSSKQVTAGANSSVYDNLNVDIKVGNWAGNLGTVDPANLPDDVEFVNTVSLAPNSYGLLKTAPRTLKFNVSKSDAPGTNAPALEIPAASLASYNYKVDGVVVDATRVGRGTEKAPQLLGVGDAYFICHASAYGTERGAQPNLAGGDPRGQLFMTTKPVVFDWDETTPGGRNSLAGMVGEAGTVDPSKSWPDGGHSSGSDIVKSPTSRSFAGLEGSGGDPAHWLQKAGDAGSLRSITELAYIFDPIQWQDTENSPFNGIDSAAWTNYLANESSVTPYGGSCGRNTLRIGRPEHPKFATNGQQAVQLLDIFAAGGSTSPSGTNLNSIQGRINLNTASTNVLRALAAGVVHTNDQALEPGGNSFVPPSDMIDEFVKAVMNFRSLRPFFSSSQLASIATTTNAADWPTNSVFGNPNLAGNALRWNDAAAEEWFAKVYPLATVRSRNFLVYSVGESLEATSLKITSKASQVHQVWIEAERDDGNTITNAVPVVIRSWQL